MQGLESIARRIHNATLLLAKGLSESGNVIENPVFFDTIKVIPRLSVSASLTPSSTSGQSETEPDRGQGQGARDEDQSQIL